MREKSAEAVRFSLRRLPRSEPRRSRIDAVLRYSRERATLPSMPYLGLRKDPGRYQRDFTLGLIVSVVFHLALVLIVSSRPAVPRRAVRLSGGSFTVSLGMGSAGGRGSPGPELRRVSPPPERKVERPVDPPKRDAPKAETPRILAARPEPAKIEPAGTGPQATGAADPSATPAAREPGPGAAGTAGGPATSGGTGFGFGGSGDGPLQIAGVDEGAFASDYYLQTVIGRISSAWAPPAGVNGLQAETAVLIRFRIMAHGQVSQAEVETSSGIPLFDRSAQDAVLRARPFPPFPPAYRGKWLTLHLRFVYGR